MCDAEMSGLSVAESSIWMRVSISYSGRVGEFKRSSECFRGTGPTIFAPANAFLILRRDCVTMGQRSISYLFIYFFYQVITVEEIVVLLSSP